VIDPDPRSRCTGCPVDVPGFGAERWPFLRSLDRTTSGWFHNQLSSGLRIWDTLRRGSPYIHAVPERSMMEPSTVRVDSVYSSYGVAPHWKESAMIRGSSFRTQTLWARPNSFRAEEQPNLYLVGITRRACQLCTSLGHPGREDAMVSRSFQRISRRMTRCSPLKLRRRQVWHPRRASMNPESQKPRLCRQCVSPLRHPAYWTEGGIMKDDITMTTCNEPTF